MQRVKFRQDVQAQMDKAIEDIVFGMADNVRLTINPQLMAYPTTPDHPQYGNPNPDPPKPKPAEEEE